MASSITARFSGRFLSIAAALVILVLPKVCHADDAACANTTKLLRRTGKLRELAVKREVPCKVSNREQVKGYLLEVIGKQLPPARLKLEEFVYKELGLFAGNFDYANGIIDLYLSQIGAYYDPERDHYVMAGWLSSELQREITVHELTHALQDQHYDLLRVIDYKAENGDLLLARAALVEGDATQVMLDFTRRRSGAEGSIGSVEVEAFTMGGVLEATLRSNQANAPRSLQLLLIFPYTSGLRFVHGITSKEGYAGLEAVYKRPPSSSEEILHLEKYLAGKPDYIQFSESDLRSPDLSKQSVMIYQDTLGEFGVSALLSAYSLKEITAAQAAKGWGGDKIMLFEEQSTRARTIIWKSNWDSAEDAKEFYNAYRQVLESKFPEGKGDGQKWHAETKGIRTSIDLSASVVTVVLSYSAG